MRDTFRRREQQRRTAQLVANVRHRRGETPEFMPWPEWIAKCALGLSVLAIVCAIAVLTFWSTVWLWFSWMLPVIAWLAGVPA